MLLAALRLSRVVTFLALGLCVAAGFGWMSPALRRSFLRWWARGLLSALGVRLHLTGNAVLHPALIVANHVSWLDVIAIAAAHPAVFVCKSEVAAWPGIGWLLRRAGTIFIRRGSLRDVWRVNLQLHARLEALQNVVAFPEGTTTAGDDVLAFKTALFQPPLDRGLPVYPVAIAYSNGDAAYLGETSFLQSLLAIARSRGLEVHTAVLPPLHAPNRRQAAARARDVIRARLAAARWVFADEEARSGFSRTAWRH